MPCCRWGSPTQTDAFEPMEGQAQHRGLTAREIAACREWFGYSIPYARVRVYSHLPPMTRLLPGSQDKVLMQMNNGSVFVNPMREAFAADYSDQPMFIHEMTHVWQYYRHDVTLANVIGVLADGGGSYAEGYAYDIFAGDDLLDFNIEQQACIIEDAFKRKRWNEPTDDERGRQFARVLRRLLIDPRLPAGLH